MRFDKGTQIQNIVSGSANWRDPSYFIKLLVSTMDLKVQKGRADCLQLPGTVNTLLSNLVGKSSVKTSARI